MAGDDAHDWDGQVRNARGDVEITWDVVFRGQAYVRVAMACGTR